jgi:hypothetical protein
MLVKELFLQRDLIWMQVPTAGPRAEELGFGGIIFFAFV